MKKEYDFSKMKELKNPYTGKKQAVGMRSSPKTGPSEERENPAKLAA
ncbi:MAG: hypothetical protein WA673_19175 [Candidatus Acidiferrales bacterium]